MTYKCNLSEDQIDQYKVKLHKKIFWLLLYKDPNTTSQYPNVNFDQYFEYLMKELNGFNKLLNEPSQMPELLSLLEAAYQETKDTPFDFKAYRKFILDAHSLIDKIGENKHD